MMTKTHSLAGLVHRMRLHSCVCDGDAAAVLALPFQVITREQLTAVVRDGDDADYCFVVLSGMVERHRLDLAGRKQILAFYIAGDPLNLDHLYLDQADDELRTTRATKLAVIARGDLRRLMADRPGVGEAAMRIFAVDASIAREWIVNVGQRDAEQRIAHLLCELEARGGNAPSSDQAWNITQYNIADATGLTSIHVNRTLKAMEARGLLVSRRGQITVDDWLALRGVGEFDTRYLHVKLAAGEA